MKSSLTTHNQIPHPVKSGLDRGEKFLRVIKIFLHTVMRGLSEHSNARLNGHHYARIDRGCYRLEKEVIVAYKKDF